MDNSPCNRGNLSFFTPFLTAKIVISAIFKSIVMISLFIYYAKVYDANIAGSLMFIFLVGNELLYSFSCKNLKHSILNKNLFSNKRLNIGVGLLMVLQFVILSTGLSKFFIVSNINIMCIVTTLCICILTFVIGELFKPVYAKLFKDY
jgi:hypothetical protein